MVRLAVTLLLIFSLFLLSNAHLQSKQPENQVVEWNPSSSNSLLVPDSASKSAILPSNHLTDSTIEPNVLLLLPTQTDAVALPRSDDAVTVYQTENQVVEWNPSSSNGLPDSASKSAISEKVIDSQATDAAELPGSETITVISNNEKLHYGFQFHSKYHHHHEQEEMEMEKQIEPRIAGEEIPYGDDMIVARTAGFLHRKRVHPHNSIGDGEGMMRLEEGKKHHKEWKKEEEDGEGMMKFGEGKMKHHKEWKKEKEDDEGIMRFKEGKMKHHKEWEKEKEDDERKMRFKEGKMKHYKKEWEKEKEDDERKMRFKEGKMKHHKKEWEKEKEDDERKMRFKEGKMKHHKMDWEKEKEEFEGTMRFKEDKMKRHKKEWKKEKEDDEGMMRFKDSSMKHHMEWKKKKEHTGLMKLFRKCLKKFFKLFD
ncbi:hypothetical protein NE237_010292 [Protea cynaroides]|uniref:Uncharacterized protein n=1 Tax=Protea cynaroides TaxID=273540 RepID=A0A9Q0R1G4_9MAGN|nr:hypothetical protein NE237_010292 [Protea cynaroides]